MAKVGCMCGKTVKLVEYDFWYVISCKKLDEMLEQFKSMTPFKNVLTELIEMDSFKEPYMHGDAKRILEYCPHCGRIITNDWNDERKVRFYKKADIIRLVDDELACDCGTVLMPQDRSASYNFVNMSFDDFCEFDSFLMGEITKEELFAQTSNVVFCPSCEKLWLNKNDKNEYEGWGYEK